MHHITELLDLEDSDIFISDITIQGTTKFLTLETKLCTNPDCRYKISDTFKFVNKRRRTTNATDILMPFAEMSLHNGNAP